MRGGIPADPGTTRAFFMPGKGQRPASTQPAPLSGDDMAMGAGLDTSPLRVQLPPQTDAGGHGRDRGSGTAPACRSLSRHHCALARSAALNSPCAASSPAGIRQTDQAASPNIPQSKNTPNLYVQAPCAISVQKYTQTLQIPAQ